MNGILFVVWTGRRWRLVPRPSLPWQTVYYYFRLCAWTAHENASTTTCVTGSASGRAANAQPPAGILDRQSIKTTSVGRRPGDDGAKKLSSRKRHPLVDVLGSVPRARVHAASLQDRAAVPLVLAGADQDFPYVQLFWADQDYTGEGKAWNEEQRGWRVDIVQCPPRPRGAWRIVAEPADPTSEHLERVRMQPPKRVDRGTLARH